MVLCTLHRHQNQDLAGWPDIGAGYPFTPDIELWKKIIYKMKNLQQTNPISSQISGI